MVYEKEKREINLSPTRWLMSHWDHQGSKLKDKSEIDTDGWQQCDGCRVGSEHKESEIVAYQLDALGRVHV